MPVLGAGPARSALGAGVRTMADAAGRTLGPSGGLVISGGTDGVELLGSSGDVARRILDLPDRAETVGAMLARHAMWRMQERAGDGGATAAVLTDALLGSASRLVEGGVEPYALGEGMAEGLVAVRESLRRQSEPVGGVDTVRSLLRHALGEPELATRIAEVCVDGPEDCRILLTDRLRDGVSYRLAPGSRWAASTVDGAGGTGGDIRLPEPYVCVTDLAVTDAAQVVPLLDAVLREDGGPLLVVAKDVSGSARDVLAANRARGVIDVVAARLVPGESWRQELADVAALTGARFVTGEYGATLQACGVADLGYAQAVRLGSDELEIAGGGGDPAAVALRRRGLHRELAGEHADGARDQLQDRIANLSGYTATVEVGAATVSATAVRRATAERMVRLARGALAEGTVAGGGAALVHCSVALDAIEVSGTARRCGVRVLRDALCAPYLRIVREAPASRWQVRGLGPPFGYDVAAGRVADLRACGIVDATTVVREAVETAVSLARSVLCTSGLVLRRRPEVSLTP